MEGIVFLSIFYWIAVAVLFLVGLIRTIVLAGRNEPTKPGLKLLIASVIMLVIGAGACAAILGNISINH